MIEKATNIEINCTVAEANPPVLFYRWFINGSSIDDSTAASYKIEKIRRSNAGRYQCDAKNLVDFSAISPATQLNVLCKLELIRHRFFLFKKYK